MEKEKQRVVAYIDGFNLYFGLKDSGLDRYLWLNIRSLIESFLSHNQVLVGVKYFTTLVTSNVEKRLRQKEYIRALNTEKLVKVYYGIFQNEANNCTNCGNTYQSVTEKMTDVHIATQMINDVHQNNFDVAMLISGDTDHIPQIRIINEEFKNKIAFVIFPPNRKNDEVAKY